MLIAGRHLLDVRWLQTKPLRQRADRWDHLKFLVSPDLCYLYASGADMKHNFTAELPPTLITREAELDERVVRTATRRTPAPEAELGVIRKRLSNLLNVQGFGGDKLEVLQADNVAPAKYDAYCVASVSLSTLSATSRNMMLGRSCVRYWQLNESASI